jgi:D-galactarolactone cycloisomerase
MTAIRRIELYHVKIPLPETFYPSWIPGFPQTENRFTLIRVFTDDGVEGFSAGPAMSRERAGLGYLLAPYLLGEDPTDIDHMQQRLREVAYLGWRCWWIEPAFWDIKGKLAGQPVCSLLGGAPRKVRLYASTGEVKGPEARIEEAEARLEEGFSAIKLRVHDFDEAVDIRQDLARAKRFADACADAGIAWLEEPLAMDGYDDLVALREHSRVPITGGELHSSGLPELRMMIERGCYDVFQPDAIFTGGIAQTFEVIRLCREHGLGYSPHTWTNGIGFAVNLQLMAASGFADDKELEYPLAPPGWTVEARDGLLKVPFHHKRGTLDVPTLPGLGIELDPRALRRHAKRYFVMDRKRLVWFSLRDRGLKASKEIDRARRARGGSVR